MDYKIRAKLNIKLDREKKWFFFTKKFQKQKIYADWSRKRPTGKTKFYIVIFAWQQGNPYQTLAVCDMWLLTQILIPRVTRGQGPVKQSMLSQAVKFRSSNFLKNFFYIYI